ncbi:MAG: hypothetical protein GVY34_06315 [Alphaproteobacteria bacterium]|jgi:hypothetical protein|nr:hypothetical protein [Alphaproteobacteria bacterium]
MTTPQNKIARKHKDIALFWIMIAVWALVGLWAFHARHVLAQPGAQLFLVLSSGAAATVSHGIKFFRNPIDSAARWEALFAMLAIVIAVLAALTLISDGGTN